MEKIKKKITEILKREGITQAEMCKSIGISSTGYIEMFKYESPKLKTLGSIADFLNVSITDLLDDTIEPSEVRRLDSVDVKLIDRLFSQLEQKDSQLKEKDRQLELITNILSSNLVGKLKEFAKKTSTYPLTQKAYSFASVPANSL